MPHENLATLAFDPPPDWRAEIAPQPSEILRISDALAEKSDAPSAAKKEPQPVGDSRNPKAVSRITVGTVLWLAALGVVAIMTAAAFLGVVFMPPAVPSKEMPATKMRTHEVAPKPLEQTIRSRDRMPIAPKQTAAPRGATPLPEQTAVPRQARLIPPVQATLTPSELNSLALEFQAWWASRHGANRTLPARTSSPQKATLTPPEEPPLSDEVTPNYSTSPTAVALQANPRPVAVNEQYRDARLRFLRQQQAWLELRLTQPNLPAAEAGRLEREKAYWGRAIAQMLNSP
jgi:hypothetical protein